jgi:hypothetical protein
VGLAWTVLRRRATDKGFNNMVADWLFSKKIDLWVLFAPVWCVWVIAFSLPVGIVEMPLPLWMWVLIVLCIDVSHVWSTIYRTYWDKDEWTRHRKLLIFAPLVCLGGALAVANTSLTVYWHMMEYMALFHFIKQQYGFFALYSAKLGAHRPKRKKFLQDKQIIYFSMLYPVLYWHLNSDTFFGWFSDGDFFYLGVIFDWLGVRGQTDILYTGASVIYWGVMAAWLLEEVWTHRREHLTLPKGKILWLLTTGINWYLGIVYFASELVFSMTNMVAHGIPYLVLIFFYVERKKRLLPDGIQSVPSVFNTRKLALNISVMFGVVLLISAVEEYFWDMFINRNKGEVFENILAYPTQPLDDMGVLTACVIAVLSLPQLTHYVLDGFIWKAPTNPYVKRVLLNR